MCGCGGPRIGVVTPYASGLLDVGEGNHVYWEASGNPAGTPALCVHGGPGGGGKRRSRNAFDPERFHVIEFDQRGCGRSAPNAADPRTRLDHNTTWHLVADMERLREQLGIDRWLLFGGSWGATLSLAYAQRHPQRVSALVLVSVMTTTADEIDWLYRGLARLLPREWSAFHAGASSIGAYAQLLASPDRATRLAAARNWCTWEDAVIAHESLGKPGNYSDRSDDDLIAFARLCAHYFGNNAWLDDRQLLRDIGAIAHIPGMLIHGRLDLGCPLQAAWNLANAWPAAELVIVDDAGHTGSPAMRAAVLAAVERFSG